MSSDAGMAPLVERPREPGTPSLIDRREAVRRVTALLGGVALVGGNALLTGCREDREGGAAVATEMEPFTEEEIAFLDEIAETILPETSTPGAKAAGVGPFMALMVTDTYYPPEQQAFREGMREIERRCQEMHGVGFMQATPEQRTALLEELDREQKAEMDRRAGTPPSEPAPAAAQDSAEGEAYLPDQRQEEAGTADAGGAAAISADAPPHFFRMMKELALLGYFTSEIGYTQAMRYVEAPGRFDPCLPYTEGEKAWAPHA
ncbi:MAG TPA: gluconate 2-dehydrogenase subunit 3 family protein [Longimicrobiaceae bacterium]